jgi:ATP-dependent RNA helicase UAP56/SUB2
MSSHDNEELVDFEDIDDVVPNGAKSTPSNGAAPASTAPAAAEKDKKNFSGIHSTGFRSVFVVL